jgi:hypothetical protein
MRASKATPKSIVAVAARLASVGFLAVAIQTANAQFRGGPGQPEEEQNATYEWSGALMSYDAGSRTAVVRARVATHAMIDNLDQFSEGDRLVLIWSGRLFASDVLDLAADPELTSDTLSLPVEFVSAGDDGEYIDFRINVPEDAVDTIASMQPGLRIRGVSPTMATEWTTSVESLSHYNAT